MDRAALLLLAVGFVVYGIALRRPKMHQPIQHRDPGDETDGETVLVLECGVCGAGAEPIREEPGAYWCERCGGARPVRKVRAPLAVG